MNVPGFSASSLAAPLKRSVSREYNACRNHVDEGPTLLCICLRPLLSHYSLLARKMGPNTTESMYSTSSLPCCSRTQLHAFPPNPLQKTYFHSVHRYNCSSYTLLNRLTNRSRRTGRGAGSSTSFLRSILSCFSKLIATHLPAA